MLRPPVSGDGSGIVIETPANAPRLVTWRLHHQNSRSVVRRQPAIGVSSTVEEPDGERRGADDADEFGPQGGRDQQVGPHPTPLERTGDEIDEVEQRDGDRCEDGQDEREQRGGADRDRSTNEWSGEAGHAETVVWRT